MKKKAGETQNVRTLDQLFKMGSNASSKPKPKPQAPAKQPELPASLKPQQPKDSKSEMRAVSRHSSQQSLPRQKLRRLVRHDTSEEQFVANSKSKSKSRSHSPESQPEQFLPNLPSRFAIGDASQLALQQKQKKQKAKSKNLPKMLAQPSKPSNPRKPKQKFTQQLKTKQKQQISSSKPKKRKDSFQDQYKQFIVSDGDIDSEQEREIRLKKVSARESYGGGVNGSKVATRDHGLKNSKASREEAELKRAMAESKEQYDVEEAIRRSMMEVQGGAGGSASKETNAMEEEEQVDENLEMYMRRNKNKGELGREVMKESKGLKEQKEVKEVKSLTKEQKPQTKKMKPISKQKPKKQSTKKQPESIIHGPLTGKLFVLTGVFPQGRQRIQDLIRSLGGVTRSAVSSRTHYLFQGTILEDGRPVQSSGKTKAAIQHRTVIVPHSELDATWLKLTDKTLSESLNYKSIAQMVMAAPGPAAPRKMEVQEEGLKERSSVLWTGKYKPRDLSEVIGQNSNIQNLVKWLESWQDVHVKGIKHQLKPTYHASSWQSGTLNSKAALISGQPGIGKTTAARMLSTLCGYSYVQYNASDIRNKSSILNIEFNSLTLDQQHKNHKRLVIMDEVDGMSSGDRGGIQAIIQVIKQAKCPIICICNDRQHDKIRTLAGYCYDVKFFRPDKRMVVRRLAEVLHREGMKADEASLMCIVETFNNDMRQILNYLDMAARSQTQLTYMNTKQQISRNLKDTLNSVNKWTASSKLMTRAEFSHMKIRQRLDLFFTDTDLLPLMVQDSLTASMPKKSSYSLQQLKLLTKSLDSICQGDLLSHKIRINQQWSLLPLQGFLTCVYPPQQVSSSLPFGKFPEWLGKNSAQRKLTRQLRQLKNVLATSITGSTSAVKYDYCAPILDIILQKLEEEDVDSVIEFMEGYRLTPEILKENLVDLQFNPRKLDLMARVSTTTKGKLTKMFNKRHETSLKVKRGKQKMGEAAGARYNDMLEELVEEESEEGKEEEKQEEVEVEIKQGKPVKAKKEKAAGGRKK